MADLDAAATVLGSRAQRDVALGPYTTYRVGGPASLFIDAQGIDDLAAVRDAVTASGAEVLIVGRGSNLLVADRGFAGIAVHLGESFATLAIEGTEVRAGGALALPVLARQTAAAALRGLEWAVGVPGSVGGGVRMNAGGHGSDIAASLVAATVFDLAGHPAPPRVVPAGDLDLGYRRSAISASQVVLDATFALAPGDRTAAEAEIAEIVRWRREHQPGGANGGSVFTNPPDDSAGRLVDAAGLKGHRVGSAFVSPKHANFFQADDGGSADDVRRLIAEVQRLVEDRLAVRLEPELRLVGEFQP